MEIWKDIPSLKGMYQASSLGRIRSLDRTIHQVCWAGTPSIRKWKGRIKAFYKEKGRLSVVVGKHETKSVHILVAEAFFGKRPEGMVCAHINGDFTDNRPENLLYCSQKENIGHKKNHKTQTFGESHIHSKLKYPDVLKIRKIHVKSHRKYGSAALARKYGIDQSTINDIVNYRTWLDAPKP